MNQPTHHRTAPDRPLRGIALMVAAVTVFGVMDTSAKFLAQIYPPQLVIWARYALQMVLMILIFGPRMRLSLIRSGTPRLQILRGLFLTIASACYFIALSFMPIAEAAAVTYSAPLFLVLIAIPMLGERADRASWIAVIAGFVGILFIIQPGAAAFTLAALLPLATGLCNAIYHGLTRKISGIDATIVSLFIPTVVGTLLTSTALLVEPAWQAPLLVWWHGVLFVSVGIMASVAHFLLIKSFDAAPAPVVAPFVYTQLVTVTLLGWLVFGQFPDGWALLGMAIVVASGVFVATHQRRRGN